MNFFKELVRDLLDQGHTVDIACNEDISPVPQYYRDWGCKVFQHDCARSPLSAGNLKAVARIRRLVREEKYDIVHCHTPVASFCTRLACAGLRGQGVSVIYTAHGFHFYKGAPLLNWVLYYPAEKICARLTDMLITINHEDYERAKRKLRAGTVEYVPGVGVNTGKFSGVTVERTAKRIELGIPENAFLLASVGELNGNKNHQVIIRAMAELNCGNMHYIIAGEGPLEEKLRELARDLDVADRVHLLGFRKDVAELYKAADIFCFPSIREGLPVSAIEAMAAGLPLVAAENRGTRELIEDGKNGFLCAYDNVGQFVHNISLLQDNADIRVKMAAQNMQKAEMYNVPVIVDRMEHLYKTIGEKKPLCTPDA